MQFCPSNRTEPTYCILVKLSLPLFSCFSLIVYWIKLLQFSLVTFPFIFNTPKVRNRVLESFYFSVYILSLENIIQYHNLNYHVYTCIYQIYIFSADFVAKYHISSFLLVSCPFQCHLKFNMSKNIFHYPQRIQLS